MLLESDFIKIVVFCKMKESLEVVDRVYIVERLVCIWEVFGLSLVLI